MIQSGYTEKIKGAKIGSNVPPSFRDAVDKIIFVLEFDRTSREPVFEKKIFEAGFPEIDFVCVVNSILKFLIFSAHMIRDIYVNHLFDN